MSEDLSPNAPRKNHIDLLRTLLSRDVGSLVPHSSEEWKAVEDAFGFQFPTSYRATCDVIPGGALGEAMAWSSPFSDDASTNLNKERLTQEYGDSQRFSEVALYPAIPGYLIFATTSMRISLSYLIEKDSTGRANCSSEVFLIDGEVDEVVGSQMEVDELIYRCITNNPPLVEELSKTIFEWEFKDSHFPLFRYIRSMDDE